MSTKTTFISTALSVSAALLLTACGGGGDSGGDMTPPTDRTPSKSDVENKAPTIAITGDKNVTIDLGSTYTDLGATATDTEDGNLTVTKTSNVDTSKVGTYKVIYNAKDSKGSSVSQTRDVTVAYDGSKLPLDTNTLFDKEKKYIYFANPQSSEGGHNSVVRIDYKNMKLDGEIKTKGTNPHSIDRAGETDKFYVRTQNSNSFEVVNFKTGKQSSKTIEFNGYELSGTNPRSIGSYNAKHKLQLLAGKHRPIIALIDVTNDAIIGVAGNSDIFDPAQTFSGHGIWFDDTYFGIVDRATQADGKYIIRMYKITDEGNRNFKIIETGYGMTFSTKLHAIERVLDPQNSKDLRTFYALGESETAGNLPPSIIEIEFSPDTGVIKRSGKITWLNSSNEVIDGISPASHHGGITPDHKYYVAPVSDGKVYFIDRKTMKIAKEIETSLDGKHKGLGAAHVEFSKSQKVAIITNHFSNFITIIDISNPDVSKYTIKAQIKIGKHAFIKPPEAKHLMQPHFALVSEDGKYFYTAASHDGVFVRVDLEKIKDLDPADYDDYEKLKNLGVLKTIEIGGVIEQSHS